MVLKKDVVRVGMKKRDRDHLKKLNPQELAANNGLLNGHMAEAHPKYNKTVKFNDLFPIGLTSLDFEATDTDVNYFTAEVVFKYTVYNIVASDGRTPL